MLFRSRLSLRVADKLSGLLLEKIPFVLREIVHDSVMQLDAVDLGRSDDAAAMTARGAALLEDYVANELGCKDPSIDQDAVELDEALGKDFHSRAVLA